MLFIFTHIVGVCNCSMSCCTLFYFQQDRADAMFSLYSYRLMIVVWHLFAMTWVYLQFVIVVIPDHTHLLLGTALFCGVLVD